MFLFIDPNGNNDPVKQFQTLIDHIFVTQRKRIERPGKECYSIHISFVLHILY